MIANLLPQDTRSVEIASAVSLLIFMVAVALGLELPSDLLRVHPQEFWIFLMGLLGSLQSIALLTYPKAEPLRTVMSWANGTFLVWISSISMIGSPDIGDIGTFFLGLSNLGAFIINLNLLREAWNH